MIEALQRAGVHVTDGSQVLEARKDQDRTGDLALDQSGRSLVDAVYEEIYRMLRPGVYEHEIVARAHQLLFEMDRSRWSGQRRVGRPLQSAPHVSRSTPAAGGPGVLRHHPFVHAGYRTCYYRTFNVGGVNQAQLDAYKQCRRMARRCDRARPAGMTTDRIAEVLADRRGAWLPGRGNLLRPQFAHGSAWGCTSRRSRASTHSSIRSSSRRGWSSRSRRTALRPTASAARIEEEVVVTASGCDVITRFPAEELLVAGRPCPRRRSGPGRA